MKASTKKPNNLERLLRFDEIRILKLLEIVQYSIFALFIGLFAGESYNKLLPNVQQIQIHNKTDLSYVTLLMILFFSGMVVILYYIKKIVELVPFFFSFVSKKYVSNKKNEAIIGVTVALAFIFGKTQHKMTHLVTLYQKYLFGSS
tara:strand:+ start:72 stop:509 length:438 start_codon:yes stop_codon:yes gene_type:complete